MPEALWYYAQNGRPVGPVPFALLQDLASRRDLVPSDLVCRAGMTEWVAAETVEGLFAPNAPPLDPLQSLASAARHESYPSGSHGTLSYYGPRRGPSSQGTAIAAFVISLIGLFICGVVLGILGIVLAVNARNSMARNNNYAGQGLATAGLVIGIIDLCGWAIILLVAIAGA